jgi:hypothetical protein
VGIVDREKGPCLPAGLPLQSRFPSTPLPTLFSADRAIMSYYERVIFACQDIPLFFLFISGSRGQDALCRTEDLAI